jgi:dsRNA-specific ribonuclease
LISKQSDEKKNRNNYKKLGCLFESFLGALFLDVNDNNGYKTCQIFLESIFNLLVDWNEILENDDNYKNIFQVKIQKEFKCTPSYKILHQDEELRYTMGVFLCLSENESIDHFVDFESIGSFEKIKDNNYKAIHFGTGIHKIKKKAEQMACLEALKKIDKYK